MAVWIRTCAAAVVRRFSASSALAMLGVAIGAANIVALISVTDTARRQTLGILRDMGMDTVIVLPVSEDPQSMAMRSSASAFLPAEFLDAVRGVSEIDLASGALLMPGFARGVERVFTIIEGVSADYPPIRGHSTGAGRFFNSDEDAGAARVCVLGYGMARKLFGVDDALGTLVTIKGEQFEVVGVMVEKGMAGLRSMDDRVFIPLTTAMELYELDGMHSIMARSRDHDKTKAAKLAVQQALLGLDSTGEAGSLDYSVNTADDLTGVLDTTMGVFRLLLYGISSVALLVAGIGIMNVMLMQVLERMREIGVRRAVGARRRDIWRQFILEALGQALAGALVGILLGIVAALVFCAVADWQFYLAPLTIVLALGVCIGVGLGFGAVPAIRAANLDPIDCLRYE